MRKEIKKFFGQGTCKVLYRERALIEGMHLITLTHVIHLHAWGHFYLYVTVMHTSLLFYTIGKLNI